MPMVCRFGSLVALAIVLAAGCRREGSSRTPDGVGSSDGGSSHGYSTRTNTPPVRGGKAPPGIFLEIIATSDANHPRIVFYDYEWRHSRGLGSDDAADVPELNSDGPEGDEYLTSANSKLRLIYLIMGEEGQFLQVQEKHLGRWVTIAGIHNH